MLFEGSAHFGWFWWIRILFFEQEPRIGQIDDTVHYCIRCYVWVILWIMPYLCIYIHCIDIWNG